MQNRLGSRNGRVGQRLVPDSLGGVDEMSPCVTPFKEDGGSIKPLHSEQQPVAPDLAPSCTANKSSSKDPGKTDVTVSSLAELSSEKWPKNTVFQASLVCGAVVLKHLF